LADRKIYFENFTEEDGEILTLPENSMTESFEFILKSY